MVKLPQGTMGTAPAPSTPLLPAGNNDTEVTFLARLVMLIWERVHNSI